MTFPFFFDSCVALSNVDIFSCLEKNYGINSKLVLGLSVLLAPFTCSVASYFFEMKAGFGIFKRLPFQTFCCANMCPVAPCLFFLSLPWFWLCTQAYSLRDAMNTLAVDKPMAANVAKIFYRDIEQLTVYARQKNGPAALKAYNDAQTHLTKYLSLI